MEEGRRAFKILIGKITEKITLGKVNIRTDLKESICDEFDYLAQDKDNRRAFVNMELNLLFSISYGVSSYV